MFFFYFKHSVLKITIFVIFSSFISTISFTNKKIDLAETRRDHCNKTVDIYEDVSSPELTRNNFGKPLTCWYRFRSFRGAPRDWVLRIRFKKFKVGTIVNASTCHFGYMQIIDGNAKSDVSNRKDPGFFCGEIEQSQTFISETSFVKVLIHIENFTDQSYFNFDTRAEQQLEVYLRYGQHPELYPNRRGEIVTGSYCERIFRDCRLQTCYVQSPAFPGIYPRNLHCKYYLNTRLPFIKLYIENEEFNVDGQRCENIMTCPMRSISSGLESCPFDFIRIYDGKDEKSAVIGTFCGMGKFPYSIIGTSQDLFVEFVSSAAGPLLNTGFHFNVGNWPGQVDTLGVKNSTCNWSFSSKKLKSSGDSEGIFLSVAHWYPPHTSCTYLIRGEKDEIIRLYFPSFRINQIESPINRIENDCGESLTIYDAATADDSKIIKTFCDTFSKAMEKFDFVSSSNSLFIRFESRTGSYSGSSLYYWAHYDFFNNTRFGQPEPNSKCNEIFHSWQTSEGYFRSPLNTLLYKQSAFDKQNIKCSYKFIANQRLHSRILIKVQTVSFKESSYESMQCENCYEDKIDKMIVWEPASSSDINNSISNTNDRRNVSCFCGKLKEERRILSNGTHLVFDMIIDSSNAANNYFKHEIPLFEGFYEFIHGPFCGPTLIEPSTDGEILFPFYEAIGYVVAPQKIHCVWEIKVSQQRDLWLHIDHIKFATSVCNESFLSVFLTQRRQNPLLTVCAQNSTLAKELPIISSNDLDSDSTSPAIRIEFVSTHNPLRNSLKIAWTELFHLPRNSDGSLMTSKLTDPMPYYRNTLNTTCDFLCPSVSSSASDAAVESLCIPKKLVCNGVQNCPHPVNFKGYGILTAADESFEVCFKYQLMDQPFSIMSISIVVSTFFVLWLLALSVIRCYHRN